MTEDKKNPTPLEKLMAEIAKGDDFPALSRTINEINNAVGDENSRASRMTDIILRDVSLTKKLLRLVNAAHYGSFGNQPISTISRAVVILGFDAVRNAAVSLMLFEHLRTHANVDLLRGEAIDSFYRGILGRMLAGSAGVRDSEEAFISALFRDLGKLMARFHFFDKTEQVSKLVDKDLQDEASASRQVFGADYDELGLAIAKHWHFPANLLHAMSPIDPAPLKKQGATDSDRLQVVASMARDLHRSFVGKTAEEQEQAIESLYLRYREAAHISRESLFETAHKAAQKLKSETAILNVDISKSALMKQLLQGPVEKTGEREGEEVNSLPEDALSENTENDATGVLVLGMQDMTAMMLGEYHLADIFKLLAELFYRTALFDHVLICVLDRNSQSLVGRVGLGQKSAQMRSAFRIPLAFAPDVFHAAIANAQDIMISDATADNIRNRIPEWHARTFHAQAFLLLPVMVRNKPLGLIYADMTKQPKPIPSQLLGLLKALRNQAALALQQKL